MVISRSFVGRGLGCGFVIGDGTLVVTAHHVAVGKSKQGRHLEIGSVSVISPYLGDGCEARIIAADEELDLAVLKIPWAGHPALKLADEADLVSAEQLVVTGIPELVRSMGAATNEPTQKGLAGQSENLAVDYVAVRRQIPRFILLGETRQLGEGWSGSPMLLPDSAVVAGCFAQLTMTKGRKGVGAKGAVATQVRHLLKRSGDAESLKPGNATRPRPADGTDAFLSCTRAYRHYLAKRYDRASDAAKRFVRLRPNSSFAYVLSAGIAAQQKNFDLADQHYRKAIALNPEMAALRLYHAQFLADRQPDKALEMLEDLWQLDEFKPAAALIMYNILSERGGFQRSGKRLTEALNANDRNAFLWLALGGCQYPSGQHDEAITNVARAVELLPERGDFRGQLARMLEQAGRLDEAEKHFRRLLRIEPKNPVVHFWLAGFLAKHRPEAKAEALKEAQIALDLPRRKSLPKEKIRQLIRELQSETKPTP